MGYECAHFCAIDLDEYLYNNCKTAEKLDIKQPGTFPKQAKTRFQTCFSSCSIDRDALRTTADTVDSQDHKLVLGEGGQASNVVEGGDGTRDLLVVPRG